MDSEYIVELSGRFLFNDLKKNEFPVVGDYVILKDNKKIVKVLERKNYLSRRTVGKKNEEQIIVSNVDIGFVVTSLNKEFNINKVERFVNLVNSNHIKPVIILTKLDLCKNCDYYISTIRSIFNDVPIVVTSSYDSQCIENIKSYFSKNITGVFLGSSGVGKSTLINLLIDGAKQSTSVIRTSDDKGRHTTTSRDLFYFKNGASIIDTPGVREIGYWFNESSINAYEDIEELSRKCKFSNCKHKAEPACAVKDALEKGKITFSRYNSYLKYQREIEKFIFCNSVSKYEYKSVLKKISKKERFSKKK